MGTQDISSLSPIDLGRALALGLEHSCNMEQISEQDRSLLAQSKIPAEKYYAELLVLAGFAQDYAIVKLLGNSGVGKQVRDGYLEVWTNMGKRSPAAAAVFQLFIQRCPEYAKAAEQMELGTTNPIALAFGGFLASDDGSAQLLALTYAPNVFFSHFEGTADIFKQSGLTRGN